MNSQFKNSRFGTLLYVFLIAIVALVTILIFWYMLFGYKIGTYSEDTLLGSVYLGGLHQEEVNEKIEDKYVDWLHDDSIVYELTYQGYNYEFRRDLFSFNIDLSMARLIDGETNELVVEYQQNGNDRENTIQEIQELPFLADVIDNVDIETLVNDILIDAGLMKTYSSKKVEDYLKNETASDVVINEYTFELPGSYNGTSLINSLEEQYGNTTIVIDENQLFDFITELSEGMSVADMSVLSKGVIGVLLESNFNLHEVHYDYVVDPQLYDLEDFVLAGRNVKVENDKSFSFHNPNDSAYKLVVNYNEADNELTVQLVGLPFVNTYIADPVEIPVPFTVKYSIYVDPSPGEDGLLVLVEREVYDINGEFVSSKEIKFEYYPPKPQYTNNSES